MVKLVAWTVAAHYTLAIWQSTGNRNDKGVPIPC